MLLPCRHLSRCTSQRFMCSGSPAIHGPGPWLGQSEGTQTDARDLGTDNGRNGHRAASSCVGASDGRFPPAAGQHTNAAHSGPDRFRTPGASFGTASGRHCGSTCTGSCGKHTHSDSGRLACACCGGLTCHHRQNEPFSRAFTLAERNALAQRNAFRDANGGSLIEQPFPRPGSLRDRQHRSARSRAASRWPVYAAFVAVAAGYCRGHSGAWHLVASWPSDKGC